MKHQILPFISPNKVDIVEPLIEEIIQYYGPNIQLRQIQSTLSQFTRSLKFLDNTPVPFGIVELARNEKTEPGLIHELLHLALPLRTNLYTIDGIDGPNSALFSALQNIAEHELILPQFLQLGYSKDDFLYEGFNTLDYKDIKDESAVWWAYSYYRIEMTKNHVGADKAAEAETALAEIRKYGIGQFPQLADHFDAIDNWIKLFRQSALSDYPHYLKSLLIMFNVGNPQRYLSPGHAGELVPKILH